MRVSGKRRQRRCRICRQRPPWQYKNCPPGVCKRCYHKHIWPDRPSVRTLRDMPEDQIDDLGFAADWELEGVLGEPDL